MRKYVYSGQVLVILLSILLIVKDKLSCLGHLLANSWINCLIRCVTKLDLPSHYGFYLSHMKCLFSLCKMRSIVYNYFCFIEVMAHKGKPDLVEWSHFKKCSDSTGKDRTWFDFQQISILHVCGQFILLLLYLLKCSVGWTLVLCLCSVCFLLYNVKVNIFLWHLPQLSLGGCKIHTTHNLLSTSINFLFLVWSTVCVLRSLLPKERQNRLHRCQKQMKKNWFVDSHSDSEYSCSSSPVLCMV